MQICARLRMASSLPGSGERRRREPLRTSPSLPPHPPQLYLNPRAQPDDALSSQAASSAIQKLLQGLQLRGWSAQAQASATVQARCNHWCVTSAIHPVCCSSRDTDPALRATICHPHSLPRFFGPDLRLNEQSDAILNLSTPAQPASTSLLLAPPSTPAHLPQITAHRLQISPNGPPF